MSIFAFRTLNDDDSLFITPLTKLVTTPMTTGFRICTWMSVLRVYGNRGCASKEYFQPSIDSTYRGTGRGGSSFESVGSRSEGSAVEGRERCRWLSRELKSERANCRSERWLNSSGYRREQSWCASHSLCIDSSVIRVVEWRVQGEALNSHFLLINYSHQLCLVSSDLCRKSLRVSTNNCIPLRTINASSTTRSNWTSNSSR